MKHPVNFRLSQRALTALVLLEKKLHASKTAVIEESLQFYAAKKLKSRSVIMKFAGALSEKSSDKMLKVIKKSRRNKNIKIAL